MKQDFAEVEDIVRILATGGISLSRGDNQIREENMVIADPNLFSFFDLEFVTGDAETALSNPTDIVLTERAVERYFGDEDPIGQTLNLMGQADVTVSAVIKDLPGKHAHGIRTGWLDGRHTIDDGTRRT